MPAYDYQLLLKRLLQQGVAWAPDQEIVFRDKVRMTYRDLYQRVLCLGGALRSLGVDSGTRVGVLEWDSHRYLELYFGVPGIGAVLHTINPGLAFEQLLYSIVHAEDEVLIFHEDFIPLVEQLRPSLPGIRQYVIMRDPPARPGPGWETAEYEELLASVAPLPDLLELDENTLATLSYTTGTTGKPKGVGFTHRQLTLQTLSDAVALSALGSYGGVTKHDVYMPLTPMFHGHAWGMPYVATLLGLKQVFPGRYEAPMILRLLKEEKVTFSHCIPTILRMVISALTEREIALQHWKVVVGGSALPKSLAREAVKLGIQVYGGYGLSETCPVLTIANLKPFMETWPEETQLDWLIKAGFTIPLVDLKVINGADQEVARDGIETGEVVVRTPWCTQAYTKDIARSEELWAGGWLHTGDLATVDEYGYIQIVDRLKDVIKSGGEWIVSLEVEKFLSQCEGVLDVAVIGVPDEKWGERPLAIVVPCAGYEENLTAEALKAHLLRYVEEGLLGSWAVPDQYLCVEEIPKTSVGKHDKKLLRGRYITRQ
jgi:fatty-acyl-CoA synthase